VPPCADNVAL
jgi:hypothetical protein